MDETEYIPLSRIDKPIPDSIPPKYKGRPKGSHNKPKAEIDRAFALTRRRDNRKRPFVKIPVLKGGFKPTSLQVCFMQTYLTRLDANNMVGPTEILTKDLNSRAANWWNWKQNPDFVKWFIETKESFHTSLGIAYVHDAIYRNALRDSPADRKLMLERFDAKYRPRTEGKFMFVGSRPDEDEGQEEEIVEQSRKFVHSEAV